MHRAEGIECRGLVTDMSDENAEMSGKVKEPRGYQETGSHSRQVTKEGGDVIRVQD